MTIFQEIISEDYLTVSEVKQHLQKIEKERAEDEERELPYELARTIEHVNRFSVLSAKDARALVKKLLELEKVSPQNACKIEVFRGRPADVQASTSRFLCKNA